MRLKRYLKEGNIKKVTMTLYHGVKDPSKLKNIMKMGFDLSYIKPNWTNDYAISALKSKSEIQKYFPNKVIPILKFKFIGSLWKSSGSFDSIDSDLGVYEDDPKKYSREIINSGVDAVELGGGLVYIYNLKKISKIELT